MTRAALPDDIASLKAMVLAQDQLIEALKLTIAKLRHEKHGASSERGRKLIDQLELQLAELEENASQDETAAELAQAAEPRRAEKPGERGRPARRVLPADLPRERLVHPAPSKCPCCGGALRKLGEDITETLEYVPARFKVIQHVREKFACRKCFGVTQPPAPFHPISRGRAGPELLAQLLFAKYRAHLPLNRQSEMWADEGINLTGLAPARRRLLRLSKPSAPMSLPPNASCRRYDGSRARQEQDPHRQALDIRSRRPAFRRAGAAGGNVLLLARPRRRASRNSSGLLGRRHAGRRLCRLWQAI